MSSSLVDEEGRKYQAVRDADPDVPTVPAALAPRRHLPSIRGEPVQSLQVCAVNLSPGQCAFQETLQYQKFLRDWRHPAPAHCRTAQPEVLIEIHQDRLGVNMEPICESFRPSV